MDMNCTLRIPVLGYSMAIATATVLGLQGCSKSSTREPDISSGDSSVVVAEVEAAVWAFHAADTARNAEAVIELLWPEYEMLADGQRLEFSQIVEGSREFMATLNLFHTVWSDLRIIPVGRNAAVSFFRFCDSIITQTGDLIRNQGPTTFLWERRNGEWRVRYGDSDHYRVDP